MEQIKKKAWIDEENRILAFHPFESGKKISKSEGVFWSWILHLIKSGYRVM